MDGIVDVRGLSCPLPVLRVKEVLEKGPGKLRVMVDAGTAKENVSRLGRSMGYRVEVEALRGGEWLIHLYMEG